MACSCGHLISDVTVIDCAALRSFLYSYTINNVNRQSEKSKERKKKKSSELQSIIPIMPTAKTLHKK